MVKGTNNTINGSEELTLRDILSALERSVGKQEGSTGQQKNLGISDLIEEFFIGISHDKNMARMADFFDTNTMTLKENDFFAKLNLQNKVKFSEFYSKK